MPQISVVIPTRNRLQMLRTSMMSVLGQQGVDLELIVVDDGSTTALLDGCRRRPIRAYGSFGERSREESAPPVTSA